MATSTAQRVGIWVIAVAMIVGTVAGFVAMILAPKNEAAQLEQAEKQYAEQIAQLCKEQAKEKAKIMQPLAGFAAKPFDADAVTKLQTKVLKKGNGATLKKDSSIKANYFGWTADGVIFDGTARKEDKKTTVTPAEFSLSEVIPGWTDGLTGQKVGSTVELTIPADQAYGTEQDVNCSPVGPLKFVVQVKALVTEKADDDE